MDQKELIALAAQASCLRVHSVEEDYAYILVPSEVEQDQDQVVEWNPFEDNNAYKLLALFTKELALIPAEHFSFELQLCFMRFNSALRGGNVDEIKTVVLQGIAEIQRIRNTLKLVRH